MKLTHASIILASLCPTFANEIYSGNCLLQAREELRIIGDDPELLFLCEDDSGRAAPLQVTREQSATLIRDIEEGRVVPNEAVLVSTGVQMSSEGVFVTEPGPLKFIKKPRTQGRGGGRKLAADGEKTVLVVKVVDSEGRKRTESLETMRQDVFGGSGDNLNMKSQFNACSMGKLNMVAGDTSSFDLGEGKTLPGIIELTINAKLTDGDPQNAITDALSTLLGGDVPGNHYDYIMYVIEKCYDGCGYAAYAYVNHWLSLYQNVYYKHSAVQMHELGHNFGLAHSGQGTATYTDHSCLMGNPYFEDEMGAMCFNPAKNWQLGWYDANKFDLELDSSAWRGDMVGIADFNSAGDRQVVIRVRTGTFTSSDSYFVGFNRAIGANFQNDEYSDDVTVIKIQGTGENYAQSTLQTGMGAGEQFSFTIEGQPHVVQVNSINLGATPAYADVCIGPETQPCPITCSQDTECNDNNPCTEDTCESGMCSYNAIADCNTCTTSEDCNDNLQCTVDTCTNGICSNVPDGSSVLFQTTITTDNYSGETEWTLTNKCDSTVTLASEAYPDANTEYKRTECVTAAEYDFTITDSYGDGICCSYGLGSYSLTYNGEIVAEGGEFASTMTENFGSCNPVASPTTAPVSQPTTAPVSQPTTAPVSQPTTAPVSQPTTAPVSQPTPPPTDYPTSAPTGTPTPNCGDGEVMYTLNIVTDANPGQTSWSIVKSFTTDVERESNGYVNVNTAHLEYGCIPDDCFEFNVMESANYELKVGDLVVASGESSSGTTKKSVFGTCCTSSRPFCSK